jgi:hypothetical protein
VTNPDPLDLLRRALVASHGGRLVAAPTAECLDDDTVAALADGRLDDARRAGTMAHLAACAHCRQAVASVARALADPNVSRTIRVAERPGRTLFYRIAVPAVAAALLLIVLRSSPHGAVHRDPTITGTAAPVPETPVGLVAEPGVLRWASVAGADRYRVTLFDAGSRVLFETELTDTVVALPDSIHFLAGRQYLWKVEARTDWDRWAASSLVEFRVAGSRR